MAQCSNHVMGLSNKQPIDEEEEVYDPQQALILEVEHALEDQLHELEDDQAV